MRAVFNRFSFMVLGAALVVPPAPVRAYTPTVTTEGRKVRWEGGRRLNLVGNARNQSGVSEDSFFQAVTRGLQRWMSASAGGVTFDYWQGTDPQTYPSRSSYDSYSAVFFSSQTGSSLPVGVLGLTEVWYDVETGKIFETDITLNDRVVQFTLDPRDSSGPGVVGTYGSSGLRKVYLENVLTHELGHAFGLSHSSLAQATMLSIESPEQAHLGCDDQIAIRSHYDSGRTDVQAEIRGQVVAANGSGVFGAHVVAISQVRGVALASAISGLDGEFSIAGVEPGSYVVMVEPFSAGIGSLPTYYQRAKTSPCVAQGFSRTFVAGSVEVAAGVSADTGQIRVSCGTGGAAVSAMAVASTPATATVAFDGATGDRAFSLVDRFQYSAVQTYRLGAVSGSLEVHALSHSISSQVRPRLSLLDAEGNPVASAQEQSPVLVGASGFASYDGRLVAPNLPVGDYFLQIRYQSLPSSQFPALSGAVDSVPFIVVTGTLGPASFPLQSELPVGARCSASESFARYTSPSGAPRKSDGSGEESKSPFGFCGTISGTTRPPTSGEIVGYLLPFLLMGAAGRSLRKKTPPEAVRA